MNRFTTGISIVIIAATACTMQPQEDRTALAEKSVSQDRKRAKFEPADGQVLLFVGQELHAIGGLDDYSDGYLDHYPAPAGFTMYSNLSPGDTSFNYVLKGLDGIWTTDDWGDNVSNMSLQLADPSFKHMALAIGLSMVNHEQKVANGEHDELVDRLGNFLKGLAPRPVFLRIGYEFDGHSWNHYDREDYLKAYKRIKDRYDEMGIDNVAYVWQSTGWVSTQEHLEAWYPGDNYVDWCAYSFFARWKEQEMIEFAQKKGKPVFIAEASPTISDFTIKFDGSTKETILSNRDQAQEAWTRWFEPLFKTVDDYPSTVKAISYINCNWRAHEMWKANPTFRRIDARLHTSKLIDQKWREEIARPRYLHASDELFDGLMATKK